MRTTGLMILSCFIVGLASGGAGMATEVNALKIVAKVFDSQSRRLGYELWNDSDRTITAWRLSLARSDSHGHAQRSILDQDFYDRHPTFESADHAGPIAPGSHHAAEWRLDLAAEEASDTALSLRVLAVVFDDLSWQGEPEAAATILEARAARVEELGRVVEALDRQGPRLRSGEEWAVALRQRSQDLHRRGSEAEAADGWPREVAAVVAATRLELARWLEDASREVSLAPDPQDALGFLVESLRERYEAGLRATPEAGLVQPDEDANGGER